MLHNSEINTVQWTIDLPWGRDIQQSELSVIALKFITAFTQEQSFPQNNVMESFACSAFLKQLYSH